MLDGLRVDPSARLVHGLVPGAAAALVSALHVNLDGPALLVVAEESEAARMAADTGAWMGPDAVEILPPMDFLPEPEATRSDHVEATRLRVIGRLLRRDPVLVVASIAALQRRLPSPNLMADRSLSVARGHDIAPETLVAQLDRLGYGRGDRVTAPGDYARRGGIIDFFPPVEEYPVRVEFFGDRVDSLRSFDPGTQRSLENTHAVHISPASEFLVAHQNDVIERALARLESEMHETTRALRRDGNDRAAARLEGRVRRQMEALRSRSAISNLDPIFPYMCDDMRSLFDYLPQRAPVFAYNPMEITRSIRGRARELAERRGRLVSDGTMMPGQMDVLMESSAADFFPKNRPRAYLSALLARVEGEAPSSVIRIRSRSPEPFYGQWEMFRSELKRWQEAGKHVVIFASDDDRARAVRGLLAEDSPRIEVAGLGRGFELPGRGLVVIAEEEIRGRARAVRGFQLPRGSRQPMESHEELTQGDYVVHRQHGIGQYLGLSRRTVEGVERDYLTLRYAEGDRLYVPADAIELVHKYASGDAEPPRIYRLGSAEWARVKAKVKESVRDLTRELVELYATRQEAEGHTFGPDTAWQREFEDSFPYEDTPDQREVTRDIKRAMERPRPMDYLLCGDVGYGKTEVAFRAAFKAMSEGKQVAFLVPTTVLAHQHYHTAKDRFGGWPFMIHSLSRFATGREQERTVAGLRRGKIDMVIGTHRLLGSDLDFRDLGLIIVDEEHRFGVGHKEQLKELRRNVDVLTLSATPIPRTLHMALSGIRDVGMITTPPEDRLPVVTYVMEYDARLVADALHRELDRGGQAFYVHNRVRSMYVAERRVHRMIPEARVGVAHGQMPEAQLEKVMEAFDEGTLDILVCTTIIESGLDMPDVNTLIVEDADRLGLAQLYQLRGRVGRSNRLAYAYLTYRHGEVLTHTAAERLHALREFTELGSGFRLAKRDLEIRGAGNVLGAEQHGFMLAVGFELYARFLREATAELRGEDARPVLKPSIEIPLDAYIPEDYIPSGAERISFYRRLGQVESLEGLADLLDEMLDRFGDPAESVINLVDLAEIRILAADRGVTSISWEGHSVILQMVPRDESIPWQAIIADMGLVARSRQLKTGEKVTLQRQRLGGPGLQPPVIRDLLKQLPRLPGMN